MFAIYCRYPLYGFNQVEPWGECRFRNCERQSIPLILCTTRIPLSQLFSPAKTICTAIIILLSVCPFQRFSSCLLVILNPRRPMMAINPTTLFLPSSSAYNLPLSVSGVLPCFHTRPGQRSHFGKLWPRCFPLWQFSLRQ